MQVKNSDIYIDVGQEEMKAIRSIMRKRRKHLMHELGIL